MDIDNTEICRDCEEPHAIVRMMYHYDYFLCALCELDRKTKEEMGAK